MTPKSEYIGTFEGIFQGVAIGWVVNVDDPNQKAVVELLCDGYAITMDRAEIARTDLSETLQSVSGSGRDVCFGYEIAVPSQALDVGASVTIRVANTNIEFTPKKKGSNQKKKQRIAGEVHANGGLLLTGWVYPKEYRVGPVELTIQEDGEEVAKFIADDPVSHQGHSSLPPLIRGFRYRLPMRLADGHVHSLRVFDDTGSELKGSPVSVAAWTNGPADLARIVEESLSETSASAEAIRSLRLGFEKAAQYTTTSMPFSDYPDWAKLFGPKPTGQTPKKMFTILLYGDGNQDASVDSLKVQEDWIERCVHFHDIDPKTDLTSSQALVFLRAGDTLDPYALEHAAQALSKNKVVYSDSDQDIDGTIMPWFKPDWDRFLFVSQGYAIGMLAGSIDTSHAPEWSTIEDLMVSMIEQAQGDIGHIDQVLYHQSTVSDHGAAPIDHDQFRRALNKSQLMEQFGAKAVASDRVHWINRLDWSDEARLPKVSIIIPTKDKVGLLKTAITTLLEITDYPDVEVIVVDNNSTKKKTLKYLKHLEGQGVHVLSYPGPFNFSAINNFAVQHATGELICLLNNDVEIFSPDWLKEMVHVLMVDRVGAVGAKLLWKNNMVQHAGVVLGIDGGAVHTGNRWSRDDLGYAGANHTLRKNSCVTAACLLLRKSHYDNLNGMNTVDFPITFNDVDLCLRLAETGVEVVWTPHAELYHLESASRGKDELAEKTARAHRELTNLRSAWANVLFRDSSYNRNLNRDRSPYEALAMPPFQTARA